MNWASYPPKEFQGETYGQKDIEFLKYIDLPLALRDTNEHLVLAMGQGVGRNRPTARLESLGWTIVEPNDALPDYATYRAFLAASRGEWSIAKNGYVKSRSGWFSCRSACYLALGRPVVVQDTGWSRHLPSGEGALAFSTPAEAITAITNVSRDYARHSQAARDYACKHFDAPKVCDDLL